MKVGFKVPPSVCMCMQVYVYMYVHMWETRGQCQVSSTISFYYIFRDPKSFYLLFGKSAYLTILAGQ